MTDSINELVLLLKHMRGPDGCAWDKKQTLSDFTKHLPEEAMEVVSAIKSENVENLREELGDLLYNILFICEIAEGKNYFTLDDVAVEIKEKIIRRHPHVFGGEKTTDVDEIIRRWHEIKKEEKNGR